MMRDLERHLQSEIARAHSEVEDYRNEAQVIIIIIIILPP